MRWRTVIFLFWTTVVSLVSWSFLHEFIKSSLQNGYSSQSVLVPFVSLYIIWFERKRIFSRVCYSPYLGIPFALIGFAAFYVGILSNSGADLTFATVVRMFGLLLIVSGGFVTLYGLDAFRAAAFPFGLLLLMLPLPDAVVDRIILFLQSQSTTLAYGLFSLIGVPVYRDGFILHMPGVSIEVARECSGINSSVALILTAVLVARETLSSAWRRAFLLLITVPLSVVKNAVRIVTLTLLAMYVDRGFLTGHLHHDGGFVFFLIALALVYPIWRLLQKSEQASSLRGQAQPASLQTASQASGR